VISTNFRPAVFALATASLTLGCHRDFRRIACTTGALKACFGTEVTFRRIPGDSTRITIRIQNLQGTLSADNTAWSQLLYIRVFRNTNPPVGFPNGGSVTPTWDASVQTLGPGAPGSGWHNAGTNSPSFVSEWVGVGGSYGTNVGYVSGRDVTYNQVANVGAGLRTYTAAATAPGWVTFSFKAGRPVTTGDVGVQISAWATNQPAASLPVPQQVGCTLIGGGGANACTFLPYSFP
jgi:hypothetical protein